MSDFILILIMLFAGFSFGYSVNERYTEPGKQAVELIKQCEAELPRNQHCELVAVPAEKP